VDDCSIDDSVAMVIKDFPTVRVIRNKTNIGYSKSYNIGTKQTKGRYILHLNSDITFENAIPLDNLIQYMDAHPTIGIAGCKLLKLNDTLDFPCKRSFPTISSVLFQSFGLSMLFSKNTLFGQYYLTYLDENKIHEVDCLMGAFMLIRREVVENIGLLDEQFFIYGEDIDYCLRTKQNGWKIIYYPKIIAKHYHGGTTHQTRWKHIVRFHTAMLQYYRKHYWNKKSLLIHIMVIFGIGIRFLGVMMINVLVIYGDYFRMKLIWKENVRKGSRSSSL
ncbi:glycosyltransferase family 2 protein, partial [Candidatus Roizmanbacteria bacterium]|nr:glycosyltransferase family 2 protein [Candidatus Roizmanbacteria bacterium]